MGEGEKKEVFETKGIDLLQVIEDAKANGNTEFAELAEKCIANVQTIYDLIAQKCTSTGEEFWRIDAEYAKGLLK